MAFEFHGRVADDDGFVFVVQNETRDFMASIRYKKGDINDLIKDIKVFFKNTAIKLGLDSIPKPLEVTLLGALAGAAAACTGIGIVSLIGAAGYAGTLGAGAVSAAVATGTSGCIGNSRGEIKKLPELKVDENTKRVQQMARQSGNNVAAFGTLFQNKPKKSISELTIILSDQSALEIDINMALEKIAHCFHNSSDGLDLKGIISNILSCCLKNTFKLEFKEDAETLAGSLVASFIKGEEPEHVADRMVKTAILIGNSHPLKHQVIVESFALIELISQMCLQCCESILSGNPSLPYSQPVPIDYDKKS